MANYVTTSLPAYVKTNQDMLIKGFALFGGTRNRCSIQTGVKGTEAINLMEIAPTLQDGDSCGFKDAGAVTLTQRNIATAAIKVNLDICPETLRGKYAEHLITIAATGQDLPFEQYLMDGVINFLQKKIEVLIWQGDKSKTTDTNIKWIDGLLKVAGAESSTVKVSIAAATPMFDAVQAVYEKLTDTAIERGAEIYLSPANFRKYLGELVAKNFFHYSGPQAEAPNEFYHPGTSVKVVNTYGLTGVDNKIYGTFAKNNYYGCDLEHGEEEIKVWWSDDADVFKLKSKWNSGVQIALPDEVVLGTIAAS